MAIIFTYFRKASLNTGIIESSAVLPMFSALVPDMRTLKASFMSGTIDIVDE